MRTLLWMGIFLHCNATIFSQNTIPVLKTNAEGDTLLYLPYDTNGILNGSFIKPDSIEEVRSSEFKMSYSNYEDLFVWVPLNQTGTFSNGVMEGSILGTREDGTLCYKRNYSNGELDGLSQRFDSAEVLLLEENYSDGKLHGAVKKYFYEGLISHEEHYENGVKHGEHNLYWSGKYVKRRTVYNHGEVDLKEVYGVKYIEEKDTTITYLSECKIGEDLLNHGIWMSYYDNGQIRKQCEYNQGVATGEWKGWYENGQLKYHMVYSEDTIVFYEEYDEDGNEK